jgi:Phosphoesterase family
VTDFDKVVNSDNMPAVSFVKAPNRQDGHAAYSDPVDEPNFITKQVNAIQKSKNWTALPVVLAYDDSDVWYDHAAAKAKNSSNNPDRSGPLRRCHGGVDERDIQLPSPAHGQGPAERADRPRRLHHAQRKIAGKIQQAVLSHLDAQPGSEDD